MDWLNLHTSILDSPEVVGAEPIDRGTWLMLMRFCIGQENSGRIVDCAAWKDRKWQQLAKVTLAEVKRESDLWAWINNDLQVAHYPLEKEAEIQRMRALGRSTSGAKVEAAKANGAKGGRPTKNPTENPTGLVLETEQENPPETHGKPIERNRKGKEEEWNGREEECAAPPIAADKNPEIIEAIRLAYPRHTHLRDAQIQIAAAIKRHSGKHGLILAGCQRIAAAVAGWSENERLSFVKNPPEFFAGDHWADDPDFWKTKQRQPSNMPRPKIDIGGRKPAGVMTSHLD